MTDRRQKLVKKLLKANPSENEEKMVTLIIERILADMADFYEKFFNAEGPGVIVYAPDNTENTMYYMTTKELITGLEDLSSRGIDGAAEVMRKGIAKAESVDPEREAIFIIEDKKGLKLFHFKREEMIKLDKESPCERIIKSIVIITFYQICSVGRNTNWIVPHVRICSHHFMITGEE